VDGRPDEPEEDRVRLCDGAILRVVDVRPCALDVHARTMTEAAVARLGH
jgi:hypothetical protein